jgi:hypothetical protein
MMKNDKFIKHQPVLYLLVEGAYDCIIYFNVKLMSFAMSLIVINYLRFAHFET